MIKLIQRAKSFFLAVIPLPPLNTGGKSVSDIIVKVTEHNNPPRKISSLFSAVFFAIFSCILFYASFIYLPSFFNYDAYGKNKHQGSSYLSSHYISDVIFGAPFSLEWNMSVIDASKLDFLSKKPLVCNGLEKGVNGNIECYFKNISQEDLNRSKFFSDNGTSTLRDLVIGSDLILGFKGNHLNSIRYFKKFGTDQDTKLDFKNQSSKVIIDLMDKYEIKLSKNALASEKSHHFVTFDIDDKNLSITISYILYDNYME